MSLRACVSRLYPRWGALGVTSQPRRHLPVCTVDTNLTADQLPTDLGIRLSRVVAEVLGKDEKLVSVSIQPSVSLCRGGSESPNAVVHIWSIGVFDAERNPKYVKPIYDFLVPTLKMPADRIALFFQPISKESAGHLLYAEQTKT